MVPIENVSLYEILTVIENLFLNNLSEVVAEKDMFTILALIAINHRLYRWGNVAVC